jgi:hypothetical protein
MQQLKVSQVVILNSMGFGCMCFEFDFSWFRAMPMHAVFVCQAGKLL